MKIIYNNSDLFEIIDFIFMYYKCKDKSLNYDVFLKRRFKPYPEIAMIYYKIVKEIYGNRFSLTQIFSQINRDHSNFSFYNKTFKNLMFSDKQFKKDYTYLLRHFKRQLRNER